MVEKKEPENPLEKAGFQEEVAEEFQVGSMTGDYGGYVRTGFPKPKRRLRLVYESQQASIEHTYFWIYNHAKIDMGYGDVIKTVDTFAASENSSFWGMTEQRKGLQQDKASQYLATIGRMIKELFQIVRELRILKERLSLYEGAAAGKQADDIALKGYWVDMVEGGNKGIGGIYVLAQQLGFGTLPDLFFGIYVKDDDDVAKVVDEKAREFNEKVREVLKRKLATYLVWRRETHKELAARKRFTLRYLRQHWAIIRMYISWVKPYLRNVQKLQPPDKYDHNPELISSFEGALIEIEFLARKAAKKGKPAATLLATFQYRVKPQLTYQADSYQNRGAVHVGKVEFSLRSYGWTEDDVNAYLQYREQETLELIGMVDTSVRDALDALGKELMDFLKEAGEDVTYEEKPEEKPEVKKEPPVDILEPFKALFSGFKEMALMPFGGEFFDLSPKASRKYRGDDEASDAAARLAAALNFQIYKNYKKAHGMPAW